MRPDRAGAEEPEPVADADAMPRRVDTDPCRMRVGRRVCVVARIAIRIE
jgi:hypothetical protein